MRKEMKIQVWTAFLWRTILGIVAILDYFLFTTGNFSLTFSLFGGWFLVTLLFVAGMTVAYGANAIRKADQRPYFLAYVVVLLISSVVLFSLSDRARLFAVQSIDGEAQEFMLHPESKRIGASSQIRELMAAIGSGKYSFEREAFTPTFRRADYVLQDSSANKYRLILVRNGTGTAEASLRKLD